MYYSSQAFRETYMYYFSKLDSSFSVLACTKQTLRPKTTLAPVYGGVFNLIFQTTFEIDKWGDMSVTLKTWFF